MLSKMVLKRRVGVDLIKFNVNTHTSMIIELYVNMSNERCIKESKVKNIIKVKYLAKRIMITPNLSI